MTRWLLIPVLLALTACGGTTEERPQLQESFAGQAVADAALRERIVIETHAYWAAIAGGDLAGAYDRFTDDYRESVPFEEWRLLRHDAGAASAVIREIRWTQAAQYFHGPELYAIVNWTAGGVDGGSEGTLIWRQGPDGRFKLENTSVRALTRPRG